MEQLQEDYEKLNNGEKLDINDMTTYLIDKSFDYTNDLPKRPEKEILSTMSDDALDYWGKFVDLKIIEINDIINE